jgi:ornithine carbamoyltransferase
MANSLIVGFLKVGMAVSVACPEGYRPDPQVMEFANTYDCFSITDKPLEAAADADVLITDVWSSMGMEAEIEKRKIAFKGYQINDDVMSAAHSDAIVMHCLPAHRGEEVSAEIMDSDASIVFDEAENRLHVQKAVMSMLFTK